MKTNWEHFKYLKQAAILFAVFIVSASVAGPIANQAQAQSAPPEFCVNGYPEDPELFEQCLIYELSNPDTSINNPIGESTTGPGTGTWGMASAEDPNSKTILFVAANPTSGSAIMGSIHDSTTLARMGQPFVIDQTSSFVGTPQVVFNPQDNRYLVIWADSRRTGNSVSIFGRFVNPDGSFAGDDFAIHNEYDVLAADLDLTYDAQNNEYVVGAHTPQFPVFRVVTSDGTVSAPHAYDLVQNGYEGMMSVVYNPVRQEYWYVTSDIVPGTSDTAGEISSIVLHRVDRNTMQIVGEKITVSPVRAARNGFTYPQIDYSPVDGAAVVVWQERGRTPGQVSEVFGRTVYNDLTMSAEYPVLTPSTNNSSNFFGAPKSMKYNPSTGTFMVATEDNNGGTTYAEFDAGGTVLDTLACILPVSGTNGTFQPNLGTANGKGLCLGSIGFSEARMVVVPSMYRAPSQSQATPSTPRVPDDLDTEDFSALISQYYIYALGIAGLLAVVMSVFGGYLVMTAAGNGAQATKGKEYIYSSIMGLVLLMAAYLILNTINTDLTDFGVNSTESLE